LRPFPGESLPGLHSGTSVQSQVAEWTAQVAANAERQKADVHRDLVVIHGDKQLSNLAKVNARLALRRDIRAIERHAFEVLQGLGVLYRAPQTVQVDVRMMQVVRSLKPEQVTWLLERSTPEELAELLLMAAAIKRPGSNPGEVDALLADRSTFQRRLEAELGTAVHPPVAGSGPGSASPSRP